MPELDAVRRIDPEEVRRRLGLPRDRPIVLYLSFPLASNPPTFWLRGVFTPSTRLGQAARTLLAGRTEYWPDVREGLNDRRLVEAVRHFCDRTGAALVVKSRLKDPIPRYTLRRADRALYDLSHYPPTILELLSVASLCVHFYSTTVLEAVYCGVPSLCLAPHRRSPWARPRLHRSSCTTSSPAGSTTGPASRTACRSARHSTGSPAGASQTSRWSARARAEYVERFLGFDDSRSSGRLLDLAEATVKVGR